MDKIFKIKEIKNLILSYTIWLCNDCIDKDIDEYICICKECNILTCIHNYNYYYDMCMKCIEYKYLTCDECKNKENFTQKICPGCKGKCCKHNISSVYYKFKNDVDVDKLCIECHRNLFEGYDSRDEYDYY